MRARALGFNLMLKLTRRDTVRLTAMAGLAHMCGNTLSHATGVSEPRPVLKAGGTGTAYELVRQLGAAFVQAGGAANFDFINNMGSSGALRATIDGVLAFAVSGRALRPEEKAAGLMHVFSLRTPFVLLTTLHSPHGLSCAEVADIYASPAPLWPDGRKLHVIIRPPSESDNALIATLFAGIAESIAKARLRPDVQVATTDMENMDLAESLQGSLAAGALNQVILENRNLNPIPIDGVAPSLESMRSGAYPMTKTMHFVTRGQPQPVIADFLRFMRSPPAQVILSRVHTEIADVVPS
jgi:phosphate transport system substrate-binding protein